MDKNFLRVSLERKVPSFFLAFECGSMIDIPRSICRGMPWNFWWKSNGLPRPNDPLGESTKFQVYNVSDEEFKQNNHIIVASNKKSEEPIVYLCSIVIDKGTEWFEVLIKKDKIRYSLARTRNRTEAQRLYERFKSLTLALLPYGPKGKKELDMAAFFQQLVLFSNKHPNFGPAHLAARMGLAQPFSQKIKSYVDQLNTQIPPLNATLLILAVLSGNEDIVFAILSLKPQLEAGDRNNASALHYAAASSSPQVFKLVLNEYIKVFQFDCLRKRNNVGYTPLHLACYNDQRANTSQLLELELPMDILNVSRPEESFKNNASRKSDTNPVSTEEVKRQQSKRVTFTRQIMEDLDWSEIRLGGTPLHWITRRRTLDALLKYHFPKDSINFNRESVIHVMVRRKRLRCLIILLSNGYDPVYMGRAKLTPLHYAILDEVATSDITLVQLLVVYDADLNAPASGGTPRHMTQCIEDQDAKNIVLFILHSLGAARCQKKLEPTSIRKTCWDGCEPGGMNNGKPFKGWPPLEGQSLYTKFLIENVVKSRRGNNGISDGQRRVNMLCCDGGGTRVNFLCYLVRPTVITIFFVLQGILAVQMLIELQKYLKQPLHQYFHWLSGTSTGSFIAAYLALKRSPQDIRRHYVTLKDNIFAGEKPYSTSTIEKFLKSIIPENIKMAEIKDKKVVITAVRANCSPVQLHLFRSYKSPDEIIAEVNGQALPEMLEHQRTALWYACRASGAAPSYFRPKDEYIDGGLIANNPTLDTLTEFYTLNRAHEAANNEENCQVLGSVLSIGTGRWPIIDQKPLSVGKISVTAPRQSYYQALALVNTLSIVSSMTDNYIVDRAQAWCSTINVPYFRLSPPISEQLPLDVKSDSELVNAM